MKNRDKLKDNGKRDKTITRHHLVPKEKVKNETYNQDYTKKDFDKVLKMFRYKHTFWHIIFGNLTLHQIILLLQRVERMKFG